MAIIQRHVLRLGKHEFAGEEDSYYLIAWLNASKGSSEHSRLVELVNSCRRLSTRYWELIERYPGTPAAGSPRPRSPKARREVKQWFLLLKELNARLSRYRLYPSFEPMTDDNIWFLSWMTPHKEKQLRLTYPNGLYAGVMGESQAVLDLVQLAQKGFVDRLRVCPCGTWFFARFSHQRFHDPECQQRFYRSSEQWKASRRAYQRKYRRLVSTRKVTVGERIRRTANPARG